MMLKNGHSAENDPIFAYELLGMQDSTHRRNGPEQGYLIEGRMMARFLPITNDLHNLPKNNSLL
jgi:hypothetical protein